MIKKFLLIFTLSFSVCLKAQYTEVINSNKPGFSESPYSVGSGVYQFESNIFYRRANATPTFSNPEALGLNLFFRTSFFSEKLEINFNTTLQNDKIAFKNIFESSYSKTGLSQFSLAAKYLVYSPKYSDKTKEIRSWKARHSFDWKRWIPHVGVYAGVNFGNLLTDYHERGGISPKVGVLLQNEFSHKLNVITNIYYDYIGSDFSQFSYIITGTYNFNNYWSGFAEMQGTFETYEKSSNLGIGAAYLFNEDLQVNASLRTTLVHAEMGIYTSIGVSYRINRHQDDFTEIDEFGNKVEKEKDINYTENKGFLGRLFDKATGIFKRKDSQKITIQKDGKAKEITVTKPKRTRQKSIISDIVKDDKRLKKAKTKAEKKAEKKASKKTKKEAKRKEKERLKLEKKIKKEEDKEAKRKEKERLKLEKEVKKLEEELKKEKEEEEKENGN